MPAPASNALLSVSGTATVQDDVDIPADAVLTIKLVSGDGEVLAGTAIAGSASTEYELVADAALVPEEKHLRLWAMLRTEAGVWGTPELAKVRDDLWLTRVDLA